MNLKAIKARIWIWKMKRKIRATKRVLTAIDKRLAAMGCPAWKRQQIRRDIITSDEAWINFLEMMEGMK